jgi:NADH:ubiquinone oxidoreductase subunit 6 (subunit J)
VIMVLNVRDEAMIEVGNISGRGLAGVAVALLVGGGLLVAANAVGDAALLSPEQLQATAADPEIAFGTIEAVGMALFSGRFLLPFEVISVLLTVAVVGAVVLAKREI